MSDLSDLYDLSDLSDLSDKGTHDDGTPKRAILALVLGKAVTQKAL